MSLKDKTSANLEKFRRGFQKIASREKMLILAVLILVFLFGNALSMLYWKIISLK